MKILSQYDSRWASETIGRTKLTLARWGCTITCISMASEYFGCHRSPPQLAKELTFTNDGLIIWQSIEKVLCFKFDVRFYRLNPALIDNAINDPSKVCLLEVEGRHWVLALDKVQNGVYEIADPLGGVQAKSTKYSRITGGAIFSGKAPVIAPSEWATEAWKWANQKGLITNSHPQAGITVEQLAVILHRYDNASRN